MAKNLRYINRLYKAIDNSLFMPTGNLDYDRITDATIKLADAIHDYCGNWHESAGPKIEELWNISESGVCCLSDFIVGAYWHYTEWHEGQWSKGYAALSALSQIYNPGMTMPEKDNEAYFWLETMARLYS